MIEFELPLPRRELSSNARVHWAKKARAVKDYRQHAFYSTYEALHNGAGALKPPVMVSYTFGTKEARTVGLYAPRDESNAIDAIKAAQDGLADALGFDDNATNMRLGPVTIDKAQGPWVRVRVVECS